MSHIQCIGSTSHSLCSTAQRKTKLKRGTSEIKWTKLVEFSSCSCIGGFGPFEIPFLAGSKALPTSGIISPALKTMCYTIKSYVPAFSIKNMKLHLKDLKILGEV